MEFKEAVEKVIDLIPNERIAEFDEVIETLKKGASNDAGGEDWEAKYRELSEIYKKRFKETIGEEIRTDVKADEEMEEPESVDVRDIDFNAETE